MSKFSRENQRRLLEICREDFPDWSNFMKEHTGRDQKLDIADLSYLAGHGLIELETSRFHENKIGKVAAKITSRGIDFLADDGGLGAVLGIVTIKVHQDTLRELLIARIEASPDQDETVKARVIDQLKSLPAEGIRSIASPALEAGINNLPNALKWVQATIGSAGA